MGSRTSSKESLSHPSLCALKENIHSHGELPYGIALASYSSRKLLLAGHGLIGVHAGWVLTSSCSENIQMCTCKSKSSYCEEEVCYHLQKDNPIFSLEFSHYRRPKEADSIIAENASNNFVL